MKKIDRLKLSLNIKEKKPAELTFRYASKNIMMVINGVIAKILIDMDHIFLLNSLVTVVREVIINAQKANAKRIFFNLNNININNPESYKKGMVLFKNNVIDNFTNYKERIKSSDYYIKTSFKWENDYVIVNISNNIKIHPEELKRINHRINKAIQYRDFSAAYDEIEDDTEGAGLGIVLTILFIRNMGIDPELFSIRSNKNLTETKFTIPKQLKPVSITTRVKTQIIDEIEGIPTFPENLIQLQKLCNDPESSINEIVDRIMVDPALSIDVIKLSNSAGFVPGKRIGKVSDAVLTIGLKNVNAILITCNSRKILNERFTKYEQIWNHCNKVAFYARAIAITLRLTGIVENVYLAGLLHDMGKIILLSVDMKIVKKIAAQVKRREIITSTIMEEISIGISHSSIGELVAKNWNFPDYLIEAIKYHHSPLSCSKDYRDITYVVFLANMLCGIEDKKYYFYYLDEDVLTRYNLLQRKKFNLFHEKIKHRYKLHFNFNN